MLGVRNIRSLSHRVKLLDGRQVHLQEGGNLEAEKTLVFMPGSAFYIFPHVGLWKIGRPGWKIHIKIENKKAFWKGLWAH